MIWVVAQKSKSVINKKLVENKKVSKSFIKGTLVFEMDDQNPQKSLP